VGQLTSEMDRGPGPRMPARLKKLRRRKRAARACQCEIVANKLRLVKIEGDRDC